MRPQSVVAFAVAALFAVVAPATAQTPPGAKPPAPAPPPAQAPAAAQAPSGGGGWSVSFDVGLDSSLAGDIYGRGNATGSLPVQLSGRTYRRAYGPGLAWSVAIGRGLSDRTEFRIRVNGVNANGERRQTGRVGTENETGTLFSKVDKLMEIGVDAGLRIYFRSGSSVQPYVGVLVGVARTKAIGFTVDVPDAVFEFEDSAALYADSTSVTGGGSFGVLFNRSDKFGIYVNVDARYRAKLKQNDGELAASGLESINDASSRVNTPLSAGIRVRF